MYHVARRGRCNVIFHLLARSDHWLNDLQPLHCWHSIMSYKRCYEGPLWSLEVRQGQPTDRKSALGLLSRLSGTNISLIFYGKVLTSSIIFQIFYNIFSKTERWDESGFLCLGNVCRGVIKIFYGGWDRSLIMSNHFTTQHRISNCAQQNFTEVTTSNCPIG